METADCSLPNDYGLQNCSKGCLTISFFCLENQKEMSFNRVTYNKGLKKEPITSDHRSSYTN